MDTPSVPPHCILTAAHEPLLFLFGRSTWEGICILHIRICMHCILILRFLFGLFLLSVLLSCEEVLRVRTPRQRASRVTHALHSRRAVQPPVPRRTGACHGARPQRNGRRRRPERRTTAHTRMSGPWGSSSPPRPPEARCGMTRRRAFFPPPHFCFLRVEGAPCAKLVQACKCSGRAVKHEKGGIGLARGVGVPAADGSASPAGVSGFPRCGQCHSLFGAC